MSGVGKNSPVLAAIRNWQQDITITTGQSAGSYNAAGRWENGTTTQTVIKATILNTSSADLRLVPENERLQGAITVYSESELLGWGAVVTWRGRKYRVLQPYFREIGSFTKAICVLHDDSQQEYVPIPPAFDNALQLEDGGFFLLEDDGGVISLEGV